jgi:hypothetical protein
MGFYSILIYANWIKLGFDGDELIWIFTRGVTNKAVGVCVSIVTSSHRNFSTKTGALPAEMGFLWICINTRGHLINEHGQWMSMVKVKNHGE